jgi:hypothetical protein
MKARDEETTGSSRGVWTVPVLDAVRCHGLHCLLKFQRQMRHGRRGRHTIVPTAMCARDVPRFRVLDARSRKILSGPMMLQPSRHLPQDRSAAVCRPLAACLLLELLPPWGQRLEPLCLNQGRS